jgi:hypothetical protein
LFGRLYFLVSRHPDRLGVFGFDGSMYFSKRKPQLGRLVTSQQFWDLGKLDLAGFCMLWGYMFWSQFLTQWYGDLPEETQWLILTNQGVSLEGLGLDCVPDVFYHSIRFALEPRCEEEPNKLRRCLSCTYDRQFGSIDTCSLCQRLVHTISRLVLQKWVFS